MDDMIAAIYPTIRKLAEKIGSCSCSYCGDGNSIEPKITANWISTNVVIGSLVVNTDWPTKHWLIIDTGGIRFHNEYENHVDYRMATQNIQWTDPDLLIKITNFMTPPHSIIPDVTIT